MIVHDTLRECDQCGQCFIAGPQAGDVCQECEEEHAAIVAEQEKERELEKAFSCRCGAYGLHQGRPYHVADCVCGLT